MYLDPTESEFVWHQFICFKWRSSVLDLTVSTMFENHSNTWKLKCYWIFIFRIWFQSFDKHCKIFHFPYNTNLVWFCFDFCGFEENFGIVKSEWIDNFNGIWILLFRSFGSPFRWQVQCVSWKSLYCNYWSYMFVASLWIFDCFGMFQETAKEPIEQYNLHNRRKSVSE